MRSSSTRRGHASVCCVSCRLTRPPTAVRGASPFTLHVPTTSSLAVSEAPFYSGMYRCLFFKTIIVGIFERSVENFTKTQIACWSRNTDVKNFADNFYTTCSTLGGVDVTNMCTYFTQALTTHNVLGTFLKIFFHLFCCKPCVCVCFIGRQVSICVAVWSSQSHQ